MNDAIDIQVLTVGAFKTNCYIVTIGTDDTYIIDPGACCDEIINKIRRLKIKYILLTHVHTDHISCAEGLSKRFKCPTFLDKNAKKYAKLDILSLKPFYPEITEEVFSDTIDELNDENIELIHISGHTNEDTCFYFKKYNMLFSGDTIFFESIGRTDLQNASREQLIQDIKKKILVLPENTIIYPGHGKSTTVEHEKKFNRFLQNEII